MVATHLKTVIHAVTVGAYTIAVDSGADFITHAPPAGTIRVEDIAKMQAQNQVAIPTITMMEGILAGKAPVTGLLTGVADLHRAGIEVLAGTDANTQPGSPHCVPHGESLHHELELMARAGIGPVDILRSATILPARAFGLTDRGAVEPGLRADLVLIDGDPTTDITATPKIRAVWCAGHRSPLPPLPDHPPRQRGKTDLTVPTTPHPHGKEDMSSDITKITQLVLHERQGRDRGWWDQMNAVLLRQRRDRSPELVSTRAQQCHAG